MQTHREHLLTQGTLHIWEEAPLMFITTYNMGNPNFTEIISQHWPYLGKLSTTGDIQGKKIMVTYRRPPFLKDMLFRAKILQPGHGTDHTPVGVVTKLPSQV